MSAPPELATRWLGRSWQLFDTLPSTNDYCKEHADALPHGAAIMAAAQTAGKGRLGRGWNASPGKSLAFSVLLHSWPLDQLGLLPLIAGLAVCRGLRALCGADCRVKWSNDILLDSKKLCGILCESRIRGDSTFAVIGIGVNLGQTAEELEHLGLVYATSLLHATGASPEPGAVAAAILNQLEPLLEEFQRDGAREILRGYRAVCVTLGQPVRVLRQGRELLGDALDIDESGGLLCRIDGREQVILAGEASVRGLYGYA